MVKILTAGSTHWIDVWPDVVLPGHTSTHGRTPRRLYSVSANGEDRKDTRRNYTQRSENIRVEVKWHAEKWNQHDKRPIRSPSKVASWISTSRTYLSSFCSSRCRADANLRVGSRSKFERFFCRLLCASSILWQSCTGISPWPRKKMRRRRARSMISGKSFRRRTWVGFEHTSHSPVGFTLAVLDSQILIVFVSACL